MTDQRARSEKQHTYMGFVDLLPEANLMENDVFRWWIVQMLLAIHGDLDSIAYSLRKLTMDASGAAASPDERTRPRANGARAAQPGPRSRIGNRGAARR